MKDQGSGTWKSDHTEAHVTAVVMTWEFGWKMPTDIFNTPPIFHDPSDPILQSLAMIRSYHVKTKELQRKLQKTSGLASSTSDGNEWGN